MQEAPMHFMHVGPCKGCRELMEVVKPQNLDKDLFKTIARLYNHFLLSGYFPTIMISLKGGTDRSTTMVSQYATVSSMETYSLPSDS